jgi:hypothetical protein
VDPAATAVRDKEEERGIGSSLERLAAVGTDSDKRGSTARRVRRRCEDWLSRLSEEGDDSLVRIRCGGRDNSVFFIFFNSNTLQN